MCFTRALSHSQLLGFFGFAIELQITRSHNAPPCHNAYRRHRCHFGVMDPSTCRHTQTHARQRKNTLSRPGRTTASVCSPTDHTRQPHCAADAHIRCHLASPDPHPHTPLDVAAACCHGKTRHARGEQQHTRNTLTRHSVAHASALLTAAHSPLRTPRSASKKRAHTTACTRLLLCLLRPATQRFPDLPTCVTRALSHSMIFWASFGLFVRRHVQIRNRNKRDSNNVSFSLTTGQPSPSTDITKAKAHNYRHRKHDAYQLGQTTSLHPSTPPPEYMTVHRRTIVRMKKMIMKRGGTGAAHTPQVFSKGDSGIHELEVRRHASS